MSEQKNQDHDYDYVIIGSGFGGSVSALRLSQKGYKVLVIEKGKWYKGKDFPKTNWDLKRWLWVPSLRLFGIMRLSLFRHVTILSGVGVGGGSLVYANTLPVPKKQFFNSGSWKGLSNWEEDLKPFYSLALKMLGAARNPRLEIGDLVLKEIGEETGRSEHFEPTNVAVYFGEKGRTVSDPYFDGKGPERTGCVFCGACMTGCRYNSKNTLDKNYLYLAQQLGLEIKAESEVFDVKPMGAKDGSDGYSIDYKDSTSFFKKKSRVTAKGVIFSAGVLGTVKLMLKLKPKSLPRLSNALGHTVRTNNESLIAITSLDKSKDFSKGIAIGSILHTDEHSHLEPVRYGAGSGFWRLLLLPFTTGNNIFIRLGKIIASWFKTPLRNLKVVFVDDWAKRTQTLLFMQHLDSTMQFTRGIFGMGTKIEKGKSPSPFIPSAEKLANTFSKKVDGVTMVFGAEPLFSTPSTAHILGGAVMGETPEKGVIDKDNHVFGYKNMMVCDGSMISANPGVNPSLSITAISELAMSKVPEKELRIRN